MTSNEKAGSKDPAFLYRSAANAGLAKRSDHAWQARQMANKKAGQKPGLSNSRSFEA
jgi:hypothetical protein